MAHISKAKNYGFSVGEKEPELKSTTETSAVRQPEGEVRSSSSDSSSSSNSSSSNSSSSSSSSSDSGSRSPGQGGVLVQNEEARDKAYEGSVQGEVVAAGTGAPVSFAEVDLNKVVAAHEYLLPKGSQAELVQPPPPSTGELKISGVRTNIAEHQAARPGLEGQHKPLSPIKMAVGMAMKKVDIPLLNMNFKETSRSRESSRKVTMKWKEGALPTFELQEEDTWDQNDQVAGPSGMASKGSGIRGESLLDNIDKKKIRIGKGETSEEDNEDLEDIEGDSSSDVYVPDIEVAQEYSDSSSEDDTAGKKRKKQKLPAGTAQRAGSKKSKNEAGISVTVKRTAKASYSSAIFEAVVPGLNFPGARFTVPEEGGAYMAGLRAVNVTFELELSWCENYQLYNTMTKNCTVCKYCERPRCGLCTGCNGKPGGVKRSGHDECHWRRCPFRSWNLGYEEQNDVVVIRMWINSVNTFCQRGFDEITKERVNRRLNVYKEMLNMTHENERRFWAFDGRAFDYPELNIEGGDKFSAVYKRHEIIRYKLQYYAREAKLEYGLNPNKSLDILVHEENLAYRARWNDKAIIKSVKEILKDETPEEDKARRRSGGQKKAGDGNRKGTLLCNLANLWTKMNWPSDYFIKEGALSGAEMNKELSMQKKEKVGEKICHT